MRNQLKTIGAISLLMATFLTVGCGQGMTSTGSMNVGGQGRDIDPVLPDNSMEKIEAESANAEQALAEAQTALDNVVKNGRVNVNSIDSGISVSSLTGLAEKLEKLLDNVLAKITAPVQKAKDMINKARGQIAGAISKLDPSRDASAIAKLQEMMAKLDAMEAKLGGLYKALASKVDMLVATVDKLIAKFSNGNPLTIIVAWELSEVRNVLAEFSAKLAAI